MTDKDQELQEKIRKESDELLFSGMELSERVKQTIRRQAAAEKPVRRASFRRAWIAGSVVAAASMLIVTGISLLQQQETNRLVPSNGAIGSQLSELILTPLSSPEEAEAAFGTELRNPADLPEGFTVSETVAIGVKGEPARDVIFTYLSGDGSKTFSFTVSRLPTSFPKEMFTSVEIDGAEGFVFEQPGLTELFWSDEGIHYSIVGYLSVEQALLVASSLQP